MGSGDPLGRAPIPSCLRSTQSCSRKRPTRARARQIGNEVVCGSFENIADGVLSPEQAEGEARTDFCARRRPIRREGSADGPPAAPLVVRWMRAVVYFAINTVNRFADRRAQ